jgi:hypothetical protein
VNLAGPNPQVWDTFLNPSDRCTSVIPCLGIASLRSLYRALRNGVHAKSLPDCRPAFSGVDCTRKVAFVLLSEDTKDNQKIFRISWAGSKWKWRRTQGAGLQTLHSVLELQNAKQTEERRVPEMQNMTRPHKAARSSIPRSPKTLKHNTRVQNNPPICIRHEPTRAVPVGMQGRRRS